MLIERFYHIIILVIAAVTFSFVSHAQDLKFTVNGKVIVDDDDVAGAVIVVTKGGAPFKKVSLQNNGKFKFDLDFQSEYLFSFEKKDYVIKKILINTKVPPDLLEDGFEPWPFNVSLFKQYISRGHCG